MADDKDNLLHCVRCHNSFKESDNSKTACEIDHDYDSFDGRREGEWYEGRLSCCGASHRFHRWKGLEDTDPNFCYKGLHTTDPAEVLYNSNTIQICDPEKCGQELHTKTKEAQKEATELNASVKAGKRTAVQEEKQRKRAKIDSLRKEGKTREARFLRAELLGLEYPPEELNSDEDSVGCMEFDDASDSSLVPPWMMDDEE